ncbi:MAG: DUF2808 domain-containing protein [bacterium]|nr:DUF2808 domain-containing protein [bacterium]
MLKRFFIFLLFFLMLAGMASAQFTKTPKAYIEIYDGLPYPSRTCDYRIVIENPAGSSAEMKKIEIDVPSGFNLDSASYAVTVNGTGASSSIQWFGGSRIIRVSFSTPLTEGSLAFLYITGAINPSSADNYTFTGTAYVPGDTSGTEIVSPASKTLIMNIKNSDFKIIPQARVEILESYNGLGASGLKYTSIANNAFVYYLYNPPDSGDSIDQATITIPLNWANAAGNMVEVTYIGTGAHGTIENMIAGTAGNPKTPVIIPFSTPLAPGSMAIIKIKGITSPNAANQEAWKCEVRNTSGVKYLCQDMTGAEDGNNEGQVPYTAGTPSTLKFAAGTFLVSTASPPQFSTYIANTPNNEYRISLYKGTVPWLVSDSPIIIDVPHGFRCGGATLSKQTNGMNEMSVSWTNGTNIKVSFTGSAASSFPIVKITGVTNPSAAGTYEWNVWYSNNASVKAVPIDFDLAPKSAYPLITTIVDKYMSSAKFDIAVTGGTSVQGTRALYTLQIYDPVGDGIDKAQIAIPAGYSSISNVDINCANSIGVSTATLTIQPTATTPGLMTLNFSTPIGEKASVFARFYAVNPPTEQDAIWSVRVSGVRDVTNTIAADLDTEGQSGNGVVSISAPAGATGLALISTTGGTATSADGNAFLTIPDEGIYASAYISISNVNPDLVPSSIAQPYLIPIGTTYKFASDRNFVKKCTVSIRYADASVKNKVVDKLVLAYWDNDTKEWKVGEECTVDKVNKVVSAKSYHLSYWRIFENQPSDGTLLSGVKVYPNPLGKDDTQVNIKFVINKPATIVINLYDFSGRLIKKLTDEAMSEGVQTVVWDGKDNNGDEASNGVYFAKITVTAAKAKEESKVKIMLLR